MTAVWIEVQPTDGGWRIQRRLNEDYWDANSLVSYPAIYRWKFQAVLVAKFLAEHESNKAGSVELIIKNRKGQIREKNTYGYDPESSKG